MRGRRAVAREYRGAHRRVLAPNSGGARARPRAPPPRPAWCSAWSAAGARRLGGTGSAARARVAQPRTERASESERERERIFAAPAFVLPLRSAWRRRAGGWHTAARAPLARLLGGCPPRGLGPARARVISLHRARAPASPTRGWHRRAPEFARSDRASADRRPCRGPARRAEWTKRGAGIHLGTRGSRVGRTHVGGHPGRRVRGRRVPGTHDPSELNAVRSGVRPQARFSAVEGAFLALGCAPFPRAGRSRAPRAGSEWRGTVTPGPFLSAPPAAALATRVARVVELLSRARAGFASRPRAHRERLCEHDRPHVDPTAGSL